MTTMTVMVMKYGMKWLDVFTSTWVLAADDDDNGMLSATWSLVLAAQNTGADAPIFQRHIHRSNLVQKCVHTEQL